MEAAASSGAARPDALSLAEFAEDRLDGPEAAAVEALLAADPSLAEDVALASRATEIPPRIGDAALAATIARAAALVPATPEATRHNVLPFRTARPPLSSPAVSSWRLAARWGALAASLALVSWLGFALGSDAYGDLAALDGQTGSRLVDELFDPPSGFFGLPDTSGT
jgi:anti-sigma factor RsiW